VTDRAAFEAKVRAACDAGAWAEAATLLVEGLGPEVLSYLRTLTRDETDAAEVFAGFCESVWTSLPRFRWESSLRTWAYSIARHRWTHLVRDPARRRGDIPLSALPSYELAERVRTSTPAHQRTDVKDRLAEIRAELSPDDRTLLVLRVDRDLEWRDIARIMSEPGDDSDDAALDRRAGALRKRFMRIKAELRVKLLGE
jgi:RNA polymerase sigma-70 factor (ECF subfamily)